MECNNLMMINAELKVEEETNGRKRGFVLYLDALRGKIDHGVICDSQRGVIVWKW